MYMPYRITRLRSWESLKCQITWVQIPPIIPYLPDRTHLSTPKRQELPSRRPSYGGGWCRCLLRLINCLDVPAHNHAPHPEVLGCDSSRASKDEPRRKHP